MKKKGISNPEAIMALIDPPSGDGDEPLTISISKDDLARQAAKYDPRVKAAEARLEFFHKAGDPTGVVSAAMEAMKTAGRHQTPRFFELVTLNQHGSPEAALFATSLYVAGLMDDPDGSIVTGLFEKALKSKLSATRVSANYGLGVHLREIDTERAKKHMQLAVDADLDVAKFAVARYLDSGIFGYEKNPEQAMKLYIDCHENHGHQLATLAIAKAVIFGARDDLPYDAEKLLAELARDGQKDAGAILRWLNAQRRHISLDIRLPQVVTPEGGNRPKMVRDAVRAQFSIPEQLIEAVTASLYGYPSWKALLEAASDKKTIKGPDDEDCGADELAQRTKFQARLLVEYLGLEETSAEVAIELLQPTGRTVRPSLKNLARMVRKRALLPRLGEDYDAIRKMVAGFGMGDPDDLMAMVYEAFPIGKQEPDLLEELDQAYVSGEYDRPDPVFGRVMREAPETLTKVIAVAGRYVNTSPWALCHQAVANMTVIPPNPVEAKRTLLLQLSQFPSSPNRPFVLALLGDVENGRHGGKRNRKAAMACYKEAASLGSPQGAFAAALLMSEGQSVRSQNAAISMYRTAIALGSEEARVNLALLFFRQRRVMDYDEAMHLMRVAAQMGDHIAIDFLSRDRDASADR
ncbi:hypothetical protein GOB57_21885 [Sinorhizobium meliloti]|nr:hypothetical protein [Sinorhizobium meliloti]